MLHWEITICALENNWDNFGVWFAPPDNRSLVFDAKRHTSTTSWRCWSASVLVLLQSHIWSSKFSVRSQVVEESPLWNRQVCGLACRWSPALVCTGHNQAKATWLKLKLSTSCSYSYTVSRCKLFENLCTLKTNAMLHVYKLCVVVTVLYVWGSKNS